MTIRCSAYSRLALILTVVPIGCSKSLDDLPREPVAGTVTMDDQPLPEGVIQFYPVEGSATSTGANAEIKDGAFSIPRESGLVPGKYKIAISHAEMKKVDSKAKKKATLSRSTIVGPERIPAKYNKQTTLQHEIKPGGDTNVRLDLQSK